jgi:molybdate/tungstate transport system substrate-binding protein
VGVAEAGGHPVRVYHAGSLNAAIGQEIGPGFTAETGISVQNVGGASVDLANEIRSGRIRPDVFMSADAEVIDQVLLGPANGDAARWYVIMCRQRMVLGYSPSSRFRAAFEAAAAGTRPWYEVLKTPGLVLKRSDPRVDPGGYRGIFVLALAEAHYGIPGLKHAVLGDDENAAQIGAGDYAALKRGEIDAAITYLTNAVGASVPYVELPREVDQSDPALASFYATASYTTPVGQTFHGTPLVYGVTIPSAAPNPDGGAAFVRYLLSEPGRGALTRRGFLPSDVLVAGDESAVPPSLRALVQGRHAS